MGALLSHASSVVDFSVGSVYSEESGFVVAESKLQVPLFTQFGSFPHFLSLASRPASVWSMAFTFFQ